MRNILTIVAFLLSIDSVYAAEPSAFGAGDLESPNPYGLTKSEKAILENKKITKQIENKSIKNATSIETIQESLDGLRSVFEGTNAKVGEQRQQLMQIQSMLDAKNGVDEQLQAQIDELKNSLTQSQKDAEENYGNFKKILKELSSLVDAINTNYVSQAKYKEDIDLILTKINEVVRKSNTTTKTNDYTQMNGAELLEDAVDAFRAKEYQKSESMFIALVDKNYKPARGNFYLGEIAYYQKRYKDAIARYKTSIELYDEASYTPTLLLHTALSFQSISDEKNANSFFDVLTSSYPDSKEASLVKNYRK